MRSRARYARGPRMVVRCRATLIRLVYSLHINVTAHPTPPSKKGTQAVPTSTPEPPNGADSCLLVGRPPSKSAAANKSAVKSFSALSRLIVQIHRRYSPPLHHATPDTNHRRQAPRISFILQFPRSRHRHPFPPERKGTGQMAENFGQKQSRLPSYPFLLEPFFPVIAPRQLNGESVGPTKKRAPIRTLF